MFIARTFALIVCVHPYCARKFTMTEQMAIAIALPGFIHLLMDHFLCRFSTFSEKNEEILSTRSLNTFFQNAPD